MVASVLNHRTIARRDGWRVLAHRLIFYGFVTSSLSARRPLLDADILAALWRCTFWRGDFYLWFS